MDHTVIIYGQNNGHEMASVFQFDHFFNVNNPPDSHQIGYAPPHMPLQTYAQPCVCSTLYVNTTRDTWEGNKRASAVTWA